MSTQSTLLEIRMLVLQLETPELTSLSARAFAALDSIVGRGRPVVESSRLQMDVRDGFTAPRTDEQSGP